MENVLYQIFALRYVEAGCHGAKINCAVIATYFAADTAGAELVGDGRVAIDCKFDSATLAASFEFSVRVKRLEFTFLLPMAGVSHWHFEIR